MDSTGAYLGQILVISDSFSLYLTSIQSSESVLDTLFIDKYLSVYDSEVPKSYAENLQSCLYFSECPSASSAFELFSKPLSTEVACRLVDETCLHVYFIFCTNSLNKSNLFLVKFKINALHYYNIDLESYLKSLII